MNWDQVEGNWKQFGGKAKEKWGKLTDDHLLQIGGRRDQLIGKVQEAYGATKEEAERQVKDWFAGLDRDSSSGEAQRSAGGWNSGSYSEDERTDARPHTARWVDEAKRDVEHRVEAVSNRVQHQPLASLAVAAGVGFVIGVLLSRR
jgi:uncharacterized protein YjbJ (UPF0337 family)